MGRRHAVHTDWTVRDLVNHVVGEDLWTVPLLEGSTIEEVGDRFEGDVLGSDPIGVARDSGRAAADATASAVPGGGTVRLSYGEDSVDNYVGQLAADLVHAWDLAVATGQDAELDEDLVSAVAAWYAPSPRTGPVARSGHAPTRVTTPGRPDPRLRPRPRWHA